MLNAGDSLLVWGAGGHGRMVADVLRAVGHRLVGFVDRDAERIAQDWDPGVAVVTEAELFEALDKGGLPKGAVGMALGIGDNHQRWKAFDLVRSATAPALIHPAAICASSVDVGRGSVVMPGAVINAGSSIGEAVIVNTGAIIEHDCLLEDATHISPGAILTGDVCVQRGAWIGAGCTILPGVTIGIGAVVGAGAVVLVDLPENCTAVGVPAKVVKIDTGEGQFLE